jgi:MFS family permease
VRSSAAAALAATTAIQVMTALAALSVPAIAPAVARELALPSSLVGSYISLVYLGSSIVALMAGGLVLRLGALRLSQFGLLLCAAALLLGIIAAPAVVALSALLLGLGYGPITPASSHLLAKTSDPRRLALTFSIKQTGVPAGTALAGLVVPPLAVAFGWRPALVAVAAMCACVAVLVQPLRRELDADRDRDARMSWAGLAAGLRLVAGSPRLRSMAALSFVFSGMQMCTSGFMVTYLSDEVGFGLVGAGIGLSAANAGGVVGRIAWGAVADRWIDPRRALLLLGASMAVAAGVCGAFTPAWPAPVVYVVCALLGATAIGWNGVFLSEVARVAPAGQTGTATGGSLFFTFVGVVVWPPLFGVLQRASGSYARCFEAAAAICAATMVVAALSQRRAQRVTAP